LLLLLLLLIEHYLADGYCSSISHLSVVVVVFIIPWHRDYH